MENLSSGEFIMEDEIRPILLVEDRIADLDLTKRALARRNLINPIQVARDGEEALDYVKRWEAGEQTPVFILLGVRLPKVNGLTVLRELKSHPRFNAIPIIMMAGHRNDIEMQEAHGLGCNSYIVKPIDFTNFCEVAPASGVYWRAVSAAQS